VREQVPAREEAVLKLAVLFVATAAAQSLAAVLGPLGVRAMLGVPREMCPSNSVQSFMYAGYLTVLALLVGLTVALLIGRGGAARRRTIVTAAAALAVASIFTAITYSPPAASAIRAAYQEYGSGRVFDQLRWAQALLTALGAMCGFVIARGSPTKS
jgi:hypothetical protein